MIAICQYTIVAILIAAMLSRNVSMGVQRIPRGDMAADVPLGDVPLGDPAIDFKKAKEIFYSKLLKKR